MQQDAEFNVQCLLRKKFVSLSTVKIFSMYCTFFVITYQLFSFP